MNYSGVASTHWFVCLAITELSLQSVRWVLTLPPFSEDIFIAKAENNDDSLQQSPVSLHGPSVGWELLLSRELSSWVLPCA